MSWTPERVETLKKLKLAGHSHSQIAEILGGVSRNAVGAKVDRLGLDINESLMTSRNNGKKSEIGSKKYVFGRTDQHKKPRAERVKDVTTIPQKPKPKNIPIIELPPKTCKWPTSMQGSTHLFCGNDTGESKSKLPYCPYHLYKALNN